MAKTIFDLLLNTELNHDHTPEYDPRYVNVTGDTMTGQLLIDLGSDTEGIIIQGDASQTANFIEFQTSGGSDLTIIDNNGWYGFGIDPTAPLHISDTNTSDSARRAAIIAQTWTPASQPGNVFPTTFGLTPSYNSTYTPTGGFLTSFRLFSSIDDSGTIPIRGVDLYSANHGSGTVDYIHDLRIRSAGNDGGGAITDYYGIWIEEQTAATNNYAIYTAGSTQSSFGGDVTVGGLLKASQPTIILTKSSSASQNVGGAAGTEVWWTWDGEDKKDTGFTHSNSTNPSRITVTSGGWYRIEFMGNAQQTGSARSTLQGIYRLNGGTTIRKGSIRDYTRGASYGNVSPGLVAVVAVGAGAYIEVGTRVESTDGTYTITAPDGTEVTSEENLLIITKV